MTLTYPINQAQLSACQLSLNIALSCEISSFCAYDAQATVERHIPISCNGCGGSEPGILSDGGGGVRGYKDAALHGD